MMLFFWRKYVGFGIMFLYGTTVTTLIMSMVYGGVMVGGVENGEILEHDGDV